MAPTQQKRPERHCVQNISRKAMSGSMKGALVGPALLHLSCVCEGSYGEQGPDGVGGLLGNATGHAFVDVTQRGNKRDSLN